MNYDIFKKQPIKLFGFTVGYTSVFIKTVQGKDRLKREKERQKNTKKIYL